MIKQTLAMTAFTAGVLLAGAAMAQAQAPAMHRPAMPAPATQGPSAPAMPQARPATSTPPVWHAHPRAEQRAVRIGSLYTDALNTLYARGFHGVHQLSLQNGDVRAMAITPNGTRRPVTVEPETHQIQVG